MVNFVDAGDFARYFLAIFQLLKVRVGNLLSSHENDFNKSSIQDDRERVDLNARNTSIETVWVVENKLERV